MSFIFYKVIAGILIFITSLASVIYPLKLRAHPSHHPILELGDAFASGIFLGAALFHMLPDASYTFNAVLGQAHYPLAESFCAGGFLLLLFLERLAQSLPSKFGSVNCVPYTLAFILIVHALIEGAVLGVNDTLSAAFVIFLAIIVHKGSESFALAVILNRSQLTLVRVIGIVGLFSLMTPIGIAIGTVMTTAFQFKSGQLITAAFNAFAAGTFLYMSTLHHINHHARQHEAEGLLEFASLLAGLMVMALLAWYA